MNIPVIFEDEWLLIVDKPSGLLTIPTPKNETRTLTSILDDDAAQKGHAFRMHPCHRLDRETSGLIIYAKGKKMQQAVMELFKRSAVKKRYLAFVSGHLQKPRGTVQRPIEGQQAVTDYEVAEQRQGFDVVRVCPHTGRTNQIRIHFKGLGHPVLGDTKFAFRRDFAVKAKRLCLHAQALEFIHPHTGKNVALDTGVPADLQEFLRTHI